MEEGSVHHRKNKAILVTEARESSDVKGAKWDPSYLHLSEQNSDDELCIDEQNIAAVH